MNIKYFMLVVSYNGIRSVRFIESQWIPVGFIFFKTYCDHFNHYFIRPFHRKLIMIFVLILKGIEICIMAEIRGPR